MNLKYKKQLERVFLTLFSILIFIIVNLSTLISRLCTTSKAFANHSKGTIVLQQVKIVFQKNTLIMTSLTRKKHTNNLESHCHRNLTPLFLKFFYCVNPAFLFFKKSTKSSFKKGPNTISN